MKAAILLLASLTPLLAEIPAVEMSSDLSSDRATYDGEILRLEGHVFLDHDLGQMEAENALLKKGRAFPRIFIDPFNGSSFYIF